MLSHPLFFVIGLYEEGRNHPLDGALRIPDRECNGPPDGLNLAENMPGAGRETYGEFPIVQIVVRDNNVDQALKALKKKMQREGLFREMKRRNHFEKPSERKAREKAEAVRRARKLARKRAQREGLLPKT